MPMFERLNIAMLVGGFLFLLGVLAAFFSLQIPAETGGDTGARTFPYLGAGALLLLGALEFRRGLRLPGHQIGMPKEAGTIVGVIFVGVLYVILISKLGYLVATALAAPSVLFLFGLRNPLGLLAAAVLSPAAYHLIFFELLGVFPPYGEWFDLLDILQGG